MNAAGVCVCVRVCPFLVASALDTSLENPQTSFTGLKYLDPAFPQKNENTTMA